jgi:hypothetical protein
MLRMKSRENLLPWLLLKKCGDKEDRTPDLSHAKRTRYHCAISPMLRISRLIIINEYNYAACSDIVWMQL